MFIGLSLSLTGRLRSSAADLYAVAGISPEFVVDFINETYRVGGSASTFDDALTYSGLSGLLPEATETGRLLLALRLFLGM